MNEWKVCMGEITNHSGAVFSSKALRKYFKIHHCKDARDKSYVDLADIYGQIVSQGYMFEKQKKTKGEGFFYTDANFIAEELCLPVRRVRELISILVDVGLLKKKTVPGQANRYAPCVEKLIGLTKDISFEHRKERKERQFKKKHDSEQAKDTKRTTVLF